MKLTYLKGIDALRFLAAMLVLIYHCNDGLRHLDPQLYSHHAVLSKGPFAVDFFFVISGFLLTYLALHELKATKTFNLKRFFMRRVLRIFPLYYLGVFLGFLVMGFIYPALTGNTFFDFNISEVIWYYIFLLPNYVIVNWQSIGPMHSLWSIGVEEQFYILFPLLIFLITQIRPALRMAIILTLCYLSFYLMVYYDYIEFTLQIKRLVVETLRFHFILLGMLLGVLFARTPEHPVLKILQKRGFQILSLSALLAVVIFLPVQYDIHNFMGHISLLNSAD